MIEETMSKQERFEAAVALEPVDRHPVFPILVTAAPRLYGITQAEAWRNHDVAREALGDAQVHRRVDPDVLRALGVRQLSGRQQIRCRPVGGVRTAAAQRLGQHQADGPGAQEKPWP